MSIDWQISLGTLVTLAFSGIISVIGLYIKSSLADIKASQAAASGELLAHQTQVKEDLTAQLAVTRQDLAVHTAEDMQRFDGISRTLNRMESKLDRINGK